MSDIRGQHGEELYWMKYPHEQFKFTDAKEIDEKHPLLTINYLEQKYVGESDEIASLATENAWSSIMRKHNLNFIQLCMFRFYAYI